MDPFTLAADRIDHEHADRATITAWRWCGDPDCDGLPHDGRGRHARYAQRLPDPGTRTTYLRGGRGSGKTWSASHIFAEWLLDSPGPGEWAVVAPTFSDARSMAIESPESGLLAALGTTKAEVDAGKSKLVAHWNRSLGELTMRDGARVYAAGADNGAIRVQGKNLRAVWADEIGLWLAWAIAWDESIRMATRIKGSRIVATGTPKAARGSVKLVRRLVSDPAVDNRLMKTLDNRGNLSEAFLDDVTGGLTRRLSMQELDGEILDESEDALWKLDQLDAGRVEAHPPLQLVVVALDPAVTANDDSDETGIIVIGKGNDGHGYVLADLSCRAGPTEVARRAVAAYEDHRANRIVAEVNNGGDYIGALIRAVDPNVGYEVVRATRGKYTRAEPVAALYERGRVHHVGRFDALESQMITYEPGSTESPDRMDALVWGAVALKIDPGGMSWGEVYAPAKPKAGEEKPPEPPNPWMEAYAR